MGLWYQTIFAQSHLNIPEIDMDQSTGNTKNKTKQGIKKY